MLGQYGVYIIPAYAVSAVVIGALAAWAALVHRVRRNEIGRLESRGFKRRGRGKSDAPEK